MRVKNKGASNADQSDKNQLNKYTKFQTKNERLRLEDHSSDEDESGYLSPLECDDDQQNPKSEGTVSFMTTKDDQGSQDNKENAINGNRKKISKAKRRRRSSARFLRMSGKFDDDGMLESGSSKDDQEQLAEMYRQVVRMNAENRINAGNSWKFSLIDNLDKFIEDDDDDDNCNGNRQMTSPVTDSRGKSARGDNTPKAEKRVNFTKASCTLDASVKIYSYRVDDVHLSSYKVLANLNRNDTGRKDDDEQSEKSKTKPSAVGERKQSVRRGCAETLETFVENINISNLEQDYDIDPLFHKMSKTFDEGGAKGLLLVNLGVSNQGCNIVFDSKEESLTTEDDINSSGNENNSDNINIAGLTSKLGSLLNGSSISSLQLVPQLESLRAEYSVLEEEGYVKDDLSPKSKRYANSAEEEKEAEESIHREALERSRASSAANFSFMTSMSFCAGSQPSDSFISPDESFGGDLAGGDFIGDDNDTSFHDFNVMEDNDKFSSFGMNDETFSEDVHSERSSLRSSKADAVLNFICNGDAVSQNSEFEYFNLSSLSQMTSGNSWAGFGHWKKSAKVRRKKTKENSPSSKSVRKNSKTLTTIDLWPSQPIDTLLNPPKGKRGGADPILLTQSARQKLSKNKNLLPFDAEIGLNQLTQFFLRPRTIILSQEKGKSVGFHDAELIPDTMYDDGDGVYDEAPGYSVEPGPNDFGDVDDYEVKELDGVRKVDKVEVGYATVAKKVDVRRLKKDLWGNLEERMGLNDTVMKRQSMDEDNMDTDTNTNSAEPGGDVTKPIDEQHPEVENNSDAVIDNGPISFKETVDLLDAKKSQGDVTLPFYFICILHLANEKCLKLDSTDSDLNDFIISLDDGTNTPQIESKKNDEDSKTLSVSRQKRQTKKTGAAHKQQEHSEAEGSDVDDESSEDDEYME